MFLQVRLGQNQVPVLISVFQIMYRYIYLDWTKVFICHRKSNQLSYVLFMSWYSYKCCLFTARKRWKQTMHASHIQGDLHCFPSILPCQRLRCWYCGYVHNPQYSQPYYNIYVQVSILQTLCLQVQQACYYDYSDKQTNKDTGVREVWVYISAYFQNIELYQNGLKPTCD